MAYCTEEQVQSLLGVFVISGNSKPNIIQATEIREMVAAEINAALSTQQITVPVAEEPAYWLSDVTYLNAVGTAAHILLAAFPSQNGPGSSAQGAMLWKAYQERLTAIRKGDTIPNDVLIPSGSGGEPRSFFTDNNAIGALPFAEDAFGSEIDANPAFAREKVF